jgi:hypothetical protein
MKLKQQKPEKREEEHNEHLLCLMIALQIIESTIAGDGGGVESKFSSSPYASYTTLLLFANLLTVESSYIAFRSL